MTATSGHPQRCLIGERRPSMRHLFYCDTTGWLGSVGLLCPSSCDGIGIHVPRLAKDTEPIGLDGTGSVRAGDSPSVGSVGRVWRRHGIDRRNSLHRLASLGITTNMIGALGMVHLPHGDPFVSKGGGPSYELATVYFACTVLFLLLGPGRCSPRCPSIRQSEEWRGCYFAIMSRRMGLA